MILQAPVRRGICRRRRRHRTRRSAKDLPFQVIRPR